MRVHRHRKTLLALLCAAAAFAPSAHAASPSGTPASTPVDPAVAMYVEQVPTSSGPRASDRRLQTSRARVEGSSGGTVVFVVALALATAAFGGTAVRRLRREKP